MSAGSPRRFPSTHQHAEIERFWADPKIIAYLQRPFEVVSTFDVPDLCGYSTDGLRYYVDRHLAAAKPSIGGKPYATWIKSLVGVDLAKKQVGHEPSEKAVEDVWGYKYPAAHEDIATPCEHLYATALGVKWKPEQRALQPFIKRSELERIEKPPLDLDCQPYYTDPDANDLRVLARLAELGVKDAKPAEHPLTAKTRELVEARGLLK